MRYECVYMHAYIYIRVYNCILYTFVCIYSLLVQVGNQKVRNTGKKPKML